MPQATDKTIVDMLHARLACFYVVHPMQEQHNSTLHKCAKDWPRIAIEHGNTVI